MKIALTQEEIKKLIDWMRFMAHEVDIDQESYNLMLKLEGYLHKEDASLTYRLKEQYKRQIEDDLKYEK